MGRGPSWQIHFLQGPGLRGGLRAEPAEIKYLECFLPAASPRPSVPSSFSLAPPLRLLLLPRPLLSPLHPAPLPTPSFSPSLSLSLSPVCRPLSLSLLAACLSGLLPPPPHNDHKSFHKSIFYVTTYRPKILEGSTVCEYGENGFFFFFLLFFGGGGVGWGPSWQIHFLQGSD